MDGKDPFAALVSGALPEVAKTEVVLPVSGSAARRAFLTPGSLGGWMNINLRIPGGTVDSVSLPTELMSADYRISVTDVVEVARKGPFILDLTARYIHPRQRVRLLGSSQRESQAAEIASAVDFDLFAIYMAQREGVVLAATTDIIAAELVALAMSELCVGAPRAFTGPWEDPVVQRATQLELGVLLPSRIKLTSNGPERSSHWTQRIIQHIRMRLGLSMTA